MSEEENEIKNKSYADKKQRLKAKIQGKPGYFNPDRAKDWMFPSNYIEQQYANH